MKTDKKRLVILKNKIGEDIFKEYAQLILTLSHLEWFLQEVLIFIILKIQFDPLNKSHIILADFISKLSFDKKIELIKQNKLLSLNLMKWLDEIRKKRNVFIHGIVLEEKNNLVIKIFHKKHQEDFSVKNISGFLNSVETIGGELVAEFESQGFKLQSDSIKK